MTAKHTPGQIRISNKYPQHAVTQNGLHTVCLAFPHPKIAKAEDNARRLVAAWNACEGIETYQLELMTSNLSIENQIKCAASRKPAGRKTAYRIQRDELLAAAQSTLAKNLHLADGDNCTLIDLKRAVKRITGAPI